MTEEFESLIKQLGEATFAQAEVELGSGTWSRACLDARFDKQEESWVGKVRATKYDGSSVSVSMSTEMYYSLVFLEPHRGTGDGEWYGMQVTVWPDRRCVVNLNYEPHCASDESFYDD